MNELERLRETAERYLRGSRKACYDLQEAITQAIRPDRRTVIAKALDVPGGNRAPRYWGKPKPDGEWGKFDQRERAKMLVRTVAVHATLGERERIYNEIEKSIKARWAFKKIEAYRVVHEGAPAPTPAPTPAPEPEPEPEPTPSVDPVAGITDSQRDMWAALGITEGIAAALEAAVPKITEKVMANVQVHQHSIPRVDGEPVILEGVQHDRFEDVMDVLRQPDEAQKNRHLWLHGPSGTGKTHMGQQCADALTAHLGREIRFGGLSCQAGMSDSALFGWLLPLGDNGRFEYQISQLVDFMINGGLFLLDEASNLPPDCAATLNMALGNLRGYLPKRLGNPEFLVSPDFYLIAADNTNGSGPQAGYIRNAQDASFLDRFRFRRIGFDKGIERTLYGTDLPWLERCWKLRTEVEGLSIGKEIGSRFIGEGALLRASWGADKYPIETCLERCTENWDDDDRAKIGITNPTY